ncbi:MULTISPECIES: nucleoside phosphorylase [Actinoalloteichus]|uniref:phosphorylase family protein n=1 Tax=Actinoalloteichus TaxID=65496 RepID=UPI0003F622F3|nr:nucleoside phosphorylase [Actinoalloteichus caeruleus]
MPRSAADPWLDGRPPHLPCGPGDLPEVCLLPGDPARVDRAAAVLDDFRVLGQNREFRVGVGRRGEVEVGVCSTGIGGPSTEIALVELARLGVRTVLRTGGMGALSARIAPGDLCVVTEAVREGGAASWYADPEVRALSSPEVRTALAATADRAGERAHGITVLSCDSYYVGEGRPVPGLEDRAARRFAQVEALGVDAMDMECETVLAVGAAVGLRVGGLLVAHASRATDSWLEDYEPAQLRMLRVAADAAARLSSEGQR